MDQPDDGVVFPAAEDGRRSTAALGRAVVADALRPVDPAGALAAEQETNWRAGYLTHFRRLVEAGLASPDAARSIAAAGLGSVHRRMRVQLAGGEEVPLDRWAEFPGERELATAEVRGTGDREEELSLPYGGARLRGDALRRRLDRWVDDGVMEPSAGDAVRAVLDHPQWLALPDATVVVLGAGAEMGPLPSLLRWGARVAGVDLARPALWQRVVETASRGAGTLLLPVPPGTPAPTRAGADLTAEAPAVAGWLAGLPGDLVLGNYVYADGAANVRVSAAVDALTVRLQEARPDLALAFLATPTDVFAVPGEAVARSVAKYGRRGTAARLLGRPLRTLSAGRLLRRAYVPGSDPGISDSLVAQQGPNYALAKRLQRWRATTARAAGTTVSLRVAPPTRTRSVVKNRALAAAYAGAHRFDVEVFEPATANVLMAALLVHDLRTGGGPAQEHPWQDEAWGAVHGGLWTTPYAPRSALGLAALLGYGSARA
jgi:hypothetical protein